MYWRTATKYWDFPVKQLTQQPSDGDDQNLYQQCLHLHLQSQSCMYELGTVLSLDVFRNNHHTKDSKFRKPVEALTSNNNTNTPREYIAIITLKYIKVDTMYVWFNDSKTYMT